MKPFAQLRPNRGLGTMQRIARSDTKMESSGVSESTMMWQRGVSRVGSLCHQKPKHVELYCHVSRSSIPPAPPAKMLKVWWIVSPHLRKLQDWRQFKKSFVTGGVRAFWSTPLSSLKFTILSWSWVINARCHGLSWNLQKLKIALASRGRHREDILPWILAAQL